MCLACEGFGRAAAIDVDALVDRDRTLRDVTGRHLGAHVGVAAGGGTIGGCTDRARPDDAGHTGG